ncbi:TIGR00730 family Rossman fold protein [Marinicella sp. W31]|uniref:LOG family protein n=1 Tax=Marinicella sp. W31 TaxID=3023713 RepID=UPI003756BE58
MTIKTLAVYCSSSDVLDQEYFDDAHAFGEAMASHQWQLVYGGGMVGLMGAVAKSIKGQGGRTIGVVPEALQIDGVVNTIDDELIITPDMHTRKAKMVELSDGYVALGGGFGTLEELLEVMTLKQLGYHEKPIVILNTRGYYNKLLDMFETIYAEQFAKQQYRVLYHVSDTVTDCISYLHNYQPPDLPDKWFV